jgi:hypothetical protein
MANHRAEQVVAAVQAAVTGLTTTGARVDRGRDDDIDAAKTPALRVATGDDTVVDPWAQSLLDSELEVLVNAYVHTGASNVETLLSTIRKEVTIALMADQKLGLAFVHSIVELGASRPDKATDGAKPAGRLEMKFRVKYRRSVADPSA